MKNRLRAIIVVILLVVIGVIYNDNLTLKSANNAMDEARSQESRLQDEKTAQRALMQQQAQESIDIMNNDITGDESMVEVSGSVAPSFPDAAGDETGGDIDISIQ